MTTQEPARAELTASRKPATPDELARAAALLIEAGRLGVHPLAALATAQAPGRATVPRYFRHIRHLGLSPAPTQFADAEDFDEFDETDLSEWDREQVALHLYGRDLQRQPWGVAMC